MQVPEPDVGPIQEREGSPKDRPCLVCVYMFFVFRRRAAAFFKKNFFKASFSTASSCARLCGCRCPYLSAPCFFRHISFFFPFFLCLCAFLPTGARASPAGTHNGPTREATNRHRNPQLPCGATKKRTSSRNDSDSKKGKRGLSWKKKHTGGQSACGGCRKPLLPNFVFPAHATTRERRIRALFFFASSSTTTDNRE